MGCIWEESVSEPIAAPGDCHLTGDSHRFFKTPSAVRDSRRPKPFKDSKVLNKGDAVMEAARSLLRAIRSNP